MGPVLAGEVSEKSEQMAFDLPEARRQAELGIERVSQRNGAWIDRARTIARQVAADRGTVTADDVRRILYAGDDRPNHFNAWGAVFRKGSGLRWTGRYRTSRVVAGHGNQQRVWELDQ